MTTKKGLNLVSALSYNYYYNLDFSDLSINIEPLNVTKSA